MHPACAESWCLLCLERYDLPGKTSTRPADTFRIRARTPARRPARCRSDFAVRVLLSILPALVAFFAVRKRDPSRGDMTVVFYLVIAVPALALVAGFLYAVWKKERIA